LNVIIYTRQGCPLCVDGIQAALAVFGEADITLVDVDLDLALLEKYTNRVPVIETIDGRVVAEGVIQESTLRALLNGAE
jgi:hypothetical protein